MVVGCWLLVVGCLLRKRRRGEGVKVCSHLSSRTNVPLRYHPSSFQITSLAVSVILGVFCGEIVRICARWCRVNDLAVLILVNTAICHLTSLLAA